ncbi:S1 RNA-binding domain-containing protein 1 [Polistes fuscatus]|uniref:S1 RNA-binding domain-containing protein 1 n=1 Tax=Polistes fuscatus TaxID=30207 RepID=UPI001CA94AA1|nr:S1 RNA-binding domain-containing protein 1 [Polistes fuscatus]
MKKSLRNNQSKLVIISSDEDESEQEECRGIRKQLRNKPIQPIIISSDEENDKRKKLVDKKETLRNKRSRLIFTSSDEDEDEKKEIVKEVVKENVTVKDDKKATMNKGKRVRNAHVRKKRKKEENVDENDDDEDAIPKEEVDKCMDVKNLKRSIKDEDDSQMTNSNAKKRKLEKDLSVEREKKNIDINKVCGECVEWTNVDYICEVQGIGKQQAQNIVKLFQEENTIPFIARYRRNMTGGMEADQLRFAKECFDKANAIKRRANTIIKAIDKLGKWTPEIHSAVVSTKSEDDLEHIYSMFKVTSKQSLAERAKSVGLGPISNAVIEGREIPSLFSLVDQEKTGLQTEEQIKEGIVHIIADVISKHKVIFDKVKMLEKEFIMDIHTVPLKTKDTSKNKKVEKSVDKEKYEIYMNFKSKTSYIKPYQILAINRAESQKVLTVKILIPDRLVGLFKDYCMTFFKSGVQASNLHLTLLRDSIDYAFKKFIKPLIVRRIRSELKERAESASIEVFATNVKQLLLTPPVRGKIVIGIDPGFSHGCKLAVVSEQGNVLETAIIYPHKKTQNSEKSSIILIDLVRKYNGTVIALGNGTACRETERFLANLIKSKAFEPLDVSYTIVDESGASIYSCSTEAKLEFNNLDPNVISAISIARRIQDPLAELVKVEPKHLGVGMYQHDLPQKQLMQSLNEVVTEVVSFVGVDINTASHSLLRKVAGLNQSRATNIIEWRNKHGPFLNRQQILRVKGIGNTTFEQCAGFIRILPETVVVAGSKIKKSKDINESLNFLDQTWIHPESYPVAYKFIKSAGCNVEEIGSLSFIEAIKAFVEKDGPNFLNKFQTDEDTLEVIKTGLTTKKDEDIRMKFQSPLFRSCLRNIEDLTDGTLLSGAVRNITHFGVFVDVGVENNGLMPTRLCKGQTLYVGQRVEVKVVNVDHRRNRFNLELIRTI